MAISIYQNPRCSKSIATMEILTNKGINPETINYLENPPTKSELSEIINKLNIEPKELIRFKEDKAKELKIAESDDRSPDEWLDIISSNPILMERPIVIAGDKAAIGRPPENILDILN